MTAERGTRETVERNSVGSLMGPAPRQRRGYLLNGTGLVEAEGEEGPGSPEGRAGSPGQPLRGRGRGDLGASACGAPP